MKYRADVDGLRAIAILFVLVYHGGLTYLPSGFVGVDIFFVISGFLITSLVHQDLEKKQFSFISFYNRRLWRLQPVFICLILVTTLLTLFFYLPDDLIQASRSARKASLFISNVFFSQTTTGYFSPDSHQLPLLHTWSLSIEWQCYLLLPLATYILFRLFSGSHLRLMLFGLTVSFFLLSLYLSLQQPAQAYFQFSSRVFEFLMGSCVAVGSVFRASPSLGAANLYPPLRASEQFRARKVENTAINILGLLLLVLLLYIASRKQILLGYPNEYAFILCAATAGIIALGATHPTSFAPRFLSQKPLVFIGLISYSLYLWHWLVFSMIRYQGMNETFSMLFLAYSLTFVLAYLSWRFIEKPARYFNQSKLQYSLVCLFLLPIAFTHISAFWITTHSGLPQRFDKELVNIYKQLNHYANPNRTLCIDHQDTNFKQCLLGSTQQHSRKALMIGDSFSNHYWGFMDVLGKAGNVSILAQGSSSCLTLPDIYLYGWWHYKDSVYQECHDQTARYFEMIKKNHYDYVLIGQIWTNYLHANVISTLEDKRSTQLTKIRIKMALEKAIQRIIESGARPILIKNSAAQKDNHACFFKHIKLRKPYHPEDCNFDLQMSKEEQWIERVFQALQRRYPALMVMDPKQVQCPAGHCKADIAGVPVYRDVGHLTDYASYQFGRLYLEKYANPFSLDEALSA